MLVKSGGAAAVLGIDYRKLYRLLEGGRIRRPAKDTAGDYVWTQRDLVRAKEALARRARRRQ